MCAQSNRRLQGHMRIVEHSAVELLGQWCSGRSNATHRRDAVSTGIFNWKYSMQIQRPNDNSCIRSYNGEKSHCIHHSYSLQRRLVSCKCQIPCNSYLTSVLLSKYYLLSHGPINCSTVNSCYIDFQYCHRCSLQEFESWDLMRHPMQNSNMLPSTFWL